MRDLLRYRRKLESRSAERNRLQKLLESANIKLASVASDVFGVSGMAMLKAIVRGDATPQEMAQLAKKRLRQKLAELELALEGKVEEHHRFVLDMQFCRLEQLDQHITKLDERVESKLEPYREPYTRLMAIPGVDRILAAVIVAEVFPPGVPRLVWVGASVGTGAAARRGPPPAQTECVAPRRNNAHARHGYGTTRDARWSPGRERDAHCST